MAFIIVAVWWNKVIKSRILNKIGSINVSLIFNLLLPKCSFVHTDISMPILGSLQINGILSATNFKP